MSLSTGTRLGPYEILSTLGAGGMGEVYRARDTTLDRDVAIKILPQAFASDPDRVARFEREAKTLAALNHANIAHIFGLERLDQAAPGAAPALVMELVEGQTLADRVARGALPLEEAIPIATQIADALEAAHDQGIIHRDLKPANIKVRADGLVKVLDFGLAKALDSGAGAPDGPGRASGTGPSQSFTNSPTITTPAMTGIGIILGTAAYMSPEQAKGRPADKRSDIWAFGCVLYEMLTGRRAFSADDVSTTLARVIERDPDWTALPAATPVPLRRLLRRSLEKDRKRRIADAADVKLELDDADMPAPEETAAAPVRQASSARRALVPLLAAGIAALAAGGVVWHLRQPSEDAPARPLRFSIDLPGRISVAFGAPSRNPLAISPDGAHLVVAANQRLYLRALDRLEMSPIAGAEAGGTAYARVPFFSPDGRSVGFWQQGELRRTTLSGGAAITICAVDSVPFGATWTADDRIFWGSPVGIMSVPAAGGAPRLLIEVKSGERFSMPQLLPGGQWVLFVSLPPGALGDQGRAVVQSLTTSERRVLAEGVGDVRYVPPGYLLYGRANTVLAQHFDLARMAVRGEAVPVLEGVANNGVIIPGMYFDVSATGTLVYLPGTTTNATSSTNLVRVARDGSRTALHTVSGMAWFPRYSRDGSRVAFGISAGAVLNDPSDLWVLDVARGALTRVTFTANNRFYPIWTRDGSRLTYADGTESTNRILTALADGTGSVQTLLATGTRRYPTSWSHDGKTLAFYQGGLSSAGGGTPSRDIWMLHLDGGKPTTTPFIETPFQETGAIFSPNDHWVAYVSNKSGQNDVYARPYPGPGEEVTISVGGGQEPVWAPSGRELFYRHEGRLLVVPIEERGTSLVVGTAKGVFDDPYRLDTGGAQGGVANYDVAPDGQHFVMVEEPKPPNATGPDRINAVVNWLDEVKARALSK